LDISNIEPATQHNTPGARVTQATVPLVHKNAIVRIAAAAHHRVRGDACADDLADERRVAAPQQFVIKRMNEGVVVG